MNVSNKYIIKICDDIDECIAISHVCTVINNKRCSYNKYGKQYCYITVFKDHIVVSCKRNKNGTDIFIVYKVDVE